MHTEEGPWNAQSFPPHLLAHISCGRSRCLGPKVRNPEHPERTIHTHASVNSLDFSGRHPALLAVGMYDGTIAIYDTAREGEVRNR